VRLFVAGISLLFSVIYGPAQAQPSPQAAGFPQRVSEFALPNGLHFVILERHEAPIVSFHAYVRAGAANVPVGQTGLTRLLERLAWSGTECIGSRDWPAEKKALDAVEESYERLQAERGKGPQADGVKVTSLEFEWQRAVDRASSLAKPGEYLQALTDQGATGIGVSVSADAVQYFCTLPSNRVELWFSMESQRLARPVLRGFYAERDNLAQQARVRPPEARIADELVAAAFVAHPYRNPVGGRPGDLGSLQTVDLRGFLERHFVPGNVTIAIAGDITHVDARRLAERSFAGAAWSARPQSPDIPTVEPVQTVPRTAVIQSPSTPLVAVGYRRPSQLDPDDAVLDAIQAILVGAKGWLVRELAAKSGAAASVRVQAAYPGARYPGLFAILVQPEPGRTVEQTVAAVQAAVDRLRIQPLDDATLARAKAHVRESILAGLLQNASAAAMLAASVAEFGDSREPLTELEWMEKLSAADVQRVAAKYFVPERRTVVYLGPETAPAAGGGK
jgi:predicted Zn-dependent peptidase